MLTWSPEKLEVTFNDPIDDVHAGEIQQHEAKVSMLALKVVQDSGVNCSGIR